MSFLSLFLPTPAMPAPPFTAVLSLPSPRPLRRSAVIFTRSRRPSGVVCCYPWDFSFDFEVIEPPCLTDIFPEYEPMETPLPPPMPIDSPLQHTPKEELDEDEYDYEYEYYGYPDPDDYMLYDFDPLW